ncbi:putative L-type lectin-domain containing receptor kinase S.1 [Cocos nucifera]|nr:putative L-type lectin-domain containing receptor kinase S.1 [Cocos nucifera]
MAEISSIGRLQHRCLVPLRGWCRKGNELMLVYGYMPNGNLSQWIFGGEGRREIMGWAARRRVLADVAEGLQYLHQGWEQVVLHRDVKSSNILLDGEMRGRLGDFGLAKLYERGAAPSNTRVVGTLGYLAPELALVATPTAASDVYSFGVVVLEAACGRRPIERAARVEDEDWVLVEWVREMHAEGRLVEVAKNGMDFREEEMELVVKLGLACCHPEPEKRPAMSEVVALLLAAEGQRNPATDPAPMSLSSGAAAD